MTVREKLVELLGDYSGDCAKPGRCHECEYYHLGNDCVTHALADYMIAKGVTFADRLEEKQATSDWMPVAEPPKTSGRYLVLFEDGHCIDAEYDQQEDGEWQFGLWHSWFDQHDIGLFYHEWISYDGITHWMPLPAPPKED